MTKTIFTLSTSLFTALFLSLSLAGCTRITDVEVNSGQLAQPAAGATAATGVAPPKLTDQSLDLADLRLLPSEEQLRTVTMPARNVPDLSVRLRPDVNEVPLVVNVSQPDYALNDVIEFWVHNPGTAENTHINAKLIYKTNVAYAWVEEGQTFEQAQLVESIDRFSTIIYPKVTTLYGNEWNPGVDNDPRLHILHTTKTGNGLAGYYSSVDEYSKLANAFSNEKEMFYINLNYLNSGQNYAAYEEVLAHELQHMIHWNRDRNEGVWMNEGLSEFAQDVAGYSQDLSFARSFLAQPGTQLNAWGTVNSSNLIHYGASYLLVRYLVQQYGIQVISDVVAQPENGIAGIESALQQTPGNPDRSTTFDDIFADWVVANYADTPDAPGLYGRWGYADFDPGKPTAQPINAMSMSILDETVNNYATDYIEIAENLPFILNFQGISSTQLAPTTIFDGQFAAWSNRGDESNSRLTRHFDLSKIGAGTLVTMSVAMWWEIEDGYDFGYVTASVDGKKWQILRGQSNTDQNISGNNFGIGYTNRSSDWRVESFDLSPYAGQAFWLRFEVVSDDAVNLPGWLIDNVSIPAIAFFDGFESPNSGWESEGWIVTENQLPQHWLVQVLEFEEGRLIDVKRPTVVDGQAQFTIRKLRNGNNVLAISGITQVATESASYQLQFEPAYE